MAIFNSNAHRNEFKHVSRHGLTIMLTAEISCRFFLRSQLNGDCAVMLQLVQAGAFMPTMLSSVSERRSPAGGGQFFAVFWVMNVDAPPIVTSLSFKGAVIFDGDARLGELCAPETDGLSDAAALPTNCGRKPWAVVELTVLGRTSLLVRPRFNILCQSLELRRDGDDQYGSRQYDRPRLT